MVGRSEGNGRRGIGCERLRPLVPVKPRAAFIFRPSRALNDSILPSALLRFVRMPAQGGQQAGASLRGPIAWAAWGVLEFLSCSYLQFTALGFRLGFKPGRAGHVASFPTLPHLKPHLRIQEPETKHLPTLTTWGVSSLGTLANNCRPSKKRNVLLGAHVVSTAVQDLLLACRIRRVRVASFPCKNVRQQITALTCHDVILKLNQSSRCRLSASLN